jgi:hypothetical protein
MKTLLTKNDIPRFTPDTLELDNGLSIRIETPYDECSEAPWERDDGRGVVTGWERREKGPGERILNTDHGSKRFFDVVETTKKAKRDGWGLSEATIAEMTAKLGRKPTKGEIVARAVDDEFDFLYGWCNDQWSYVVIVVTLLDVDGKELASDCLGGVESLGDYWREQAAEMANALIAGHETETAERAHWEARDTITT